MMKRAAFSITVHSQDHRVHSAMTRRACFIDDASQTADGLGSVATSAPSAPSDSESSASADCASSAAVTTSLRRRAAAQHLSSTTDHDANAISVATYAKRSNVNNVITNTNTSNDDDDDANDSACGGSDVGNEYASCGETRHIASERYAREFALPTYEFRDIKAAVPAHCFERSTLRSLGFVAHDYLLAGMLLMLATQIVRVDSVAMRAACWVAYWIAQGIVLTGTWVLAHECGHQAFSPRGWINDTAGFIMHSLLLVPYFSWKYSHARHHSATAHVKRDMVFVPWTRSRYAAAVPNGAKLLEPRSDAAGHEESVLEDAPLRNLFGLIGILLVGWIMYLIRNASGQRYPEHRGLVSHFAPNAPIFSKRQRPFVLLSAVGVATVAALLVVAARRFGALNVFFYYGVPYLNVNAWLVFITFLQHTDARVPHYSANTWNFVRGALCTVDRDYGTILNHFLHHINDTHVAHHLFSLIPHYHAQEATEAIKPLIKNHYIFEDGPLIRNAIREFSQCKFVEDSGDVLWYKN